MRTHWLSSVKLLITYGDAMKVITAYTHKGGTGKTTILFMIANAIAARNETALLIDCDDHRSFEEYRNLSRRDGVDWWDEGLEVRYMNFESTPVLHLEENLIAADESGKYDYCLLNLQGSDHPFNRHVLRYAELTLLPFAPAALDGRLLPRAVNVLRELSQSSEIGDVRVIFNKMRSQMSTSQTAEIEHALDVFSTMRTSIKELVVLRDLVNVGLLTKTIANPMPEVSGFDPLRVHLFKQALEMCQELMTEINEVIDKTATKEALA